MHRLHKVGIVVNVALTVFLIGYALWLQRCLTHERRLVSRLPRVIQMARDEVWAEVAEERAKAARERVEAARLKQTCPAPPKCPICPKCRDPPKCPICPKCKNPPKCPECPKCRNPPKCPECKACPAPKCPASSSNAANATEWLLRTFEWSEIASSSSEHEANMLQALECLRIVVSDRIGVAAHRVLRLPSKASAATEVKSAKRSIARRVHPDKVGAEWARSVCEEATRVINALR